MVDCLAEACSMMLLYLALDLMLASYSFGLSGSAWNSLRGLANFNDFYYASEFTPGINPVGPI